MEKSHQTSKKMVDFSKYLSFVLRHGAQEVGVHMDKQGYVSVDEIMKTKRAKGYTFNDLKFVVDNNNKKRFEINEVDEDGKKVLKIRAVQGHTITVGQADAGLGRRVLVHRGHGRGRGADDHPRYGLQGVDQLHPLPGAEAHGEEPHP